MRKLCFIALAQARKLPPRMFFVDNTEPFLVNEALSVYPPNGVISSLTRRPIDYVEG